MMVGFVYGLTYHAKHRQPADPSYEFYDTTSVKIFIEGSKEIHDVYGRFNNILEGYRQLEKAKFLGDSVYQLVFKVNCPRPAFLFIDDEPIEIFLVPGDSSLHVQLEYSPSTYQIEALNFKGKTKGICEYYQKKTAYFGRSHIRAARHIVDSDSFSAFSAKLDSMAAKELSFLSEQQIFSTLPQWFANFEQNEILYQKAYLKLAHAFNKEVPSEQLDQIDTQNPDAVFSYYYYLFLRTYFTHLDPLHGQPDPTSDRARMAHELQHQMEMADKYLKEGPHDVFMSRIIFTLLKQKNLKLAKALFKRYEDTFFSKKYVRFLDMQIENYHQPS